jgi:hypothetical protein
MDADDPLAHLPEEDPDRFGYSGVDPALKGDWEPLIERLRSEETITRRERELLALILEGKIKRPKRRPRSRAQDEIEEAIAYLVMRREAEGVKTKAAVHDAMVEFGRKERTVRSAVSRHRWRWCGPQHDNLATIGTMSARKRCKQVLLLCRKMPARMAIAFGGRAHRTQQWHRRNYWRTS